MQPKLIPLSIPQIDIPTFLSLCQQALGYDAARPVDKSRRPQDEHIQFLSALSCFHSQSNTEKPLSDILANAAYFCAHLHFSFIAVADRDTLFESLERSGLHHTVAPDADVAVISGTLHEWISGIKACCTTDTTFNTRFLYDLALLHFEKAGLFPAFQARKKSHSDRTFLLESR